MKRKLEAIAPPGVNVRKTLRWFWILLALCAAEILFNYLFLLALGMEGYEEAHEAGREITCEPFAKDYLTVLRTSFFEFALLKGALLRFSPDIGYSFEFMPPPLFLCVTLLYLLALPIRFYRLFREESQSVYTMRRLSRRSEYHLRCWGLTLFGIAVLILTLLVVAAVCYGFYCAQTPDWLQPRLF